MRADPRRDRLRDRLRDRRLPGGGPLVLSLVLVGALTLLAALGWGAYEILRDDPSCGTGVEERGPRDECTGVTDGSVVFDASMEDELGGLFGLIEAENERVEQQPQDYVTIAFLIPMNPANDVERQQIVREVQGAYLAQYGANRENDQQPLIRLVLANPGQEGEQWRPVAKQLVELSRDEDANLRAVVGFNASLPSTRDALGYLTERGISVVAGPVTAADLKNDEEGSYPGLVKVVPDNADQAAALGNYLSEVQGTVIDPEDTLLVEDLREGDSYVDSLSEVFQEATAGSRYGTRGFTSPGVTEVGTTANQFAQMVNNVCAMPDNVRWIYFSGRPVHLRVFINELGDRVCQDREITVITGSGASTLAGDDELEISALRSGVTVQYTAVAHPDEWSTGDVPGNGGSAEGVETLERLAAEQDPDALGEVSLDDSRTITMYDAMLTAVQGIRLAAGGAVPSTQAVGDIWSQLNGYNRVEGASGWICLDAYGNASNKAVAIVSLDPESPGSIRFEAVAWPEGREPDEGCLVTSTR